MSSHLVIVSVSDTDVTLDWGAVTREDLLNGDHNPLYVYCGIKTLAELAAWQFAKEHSVLDLASSEHRSRISARSFGRLTRFF